MLTSRKDSIILTTQILAQEALKLLNYEIKCLKASLVEISFTEHSIHLYFMLLIIFEFISSLDEHLILFFWQTGADEIKKKTETEKIVTRFRDLNFLLNDISS